MIRAEYLRFLKMLDLESISLDEIKIANLVLVNLECLVPLSTNQGQRIKAVVRIAQTEWNTLSSEIQPLPERLVVNKSPITQLKSLKVGPFRGFSREEYFDLTSKLVLIYGPNGTGKSSFCEAL